ncbi:MAG TPA: NADH-ubiquinone oxidoreductase-F iron-sulfur binding region domain-containing protein [Thermoanaerobaculia bacterium]|nr:NADH-ubiquinone oxidoreductase-F iron-sulfur binding region domain-containing protein [Thermoanaerobaculia bacterium]
MDLHFTDDQPTPEEREAIDACLSSLPGGDLRHLRQYLLPVLHAIQGRVGWISPGALNHACRALDVPPADAFGVADFYALFQTRPHPPVAIHVCDDIGCQFHGAEALCAQVAGTGLTWHRSPCLGLCERAPAAMITVAGNPPREFCLAPATPEDILSSALSVPAVLDVPSAALSVPQLGHPSLTLLRRVGRIDPWSLDDYRAAGGFLALRRAFEMGPDRVVSEVIEAKLVGRGGAAFPTGQKWLGMRSAPLPRYLVCNADESEPGTFKDRVIMEGDPYSLIESMIIAGFATGCERGYLYIRGEYPLATALLENAILRCRERGFLGEDILGDGVRIDIELRRGAGAYICGEETALLNSLEGYRGEPRNKPPFPTQVGLFGQPTAINNVETLVNVLPILIEGGKAFAAIGTERSTGPKLFCLSGHVRRPGVYEVPFGVTLRELLERAGGVGGSGRLQTILLGGAAGAFITPDQIDVPLTFEGTRAIGAALGSGVIMPFDDTVDLRPVLRRIAQFFRDESCGQCVPCRVGTVRQEEVLHRLASDRPFGSVEQELSLLKELGQVMRDASICGLGQTASSAIESALAKLPILQENRQEKR